MASTSNDGDPDTALEQVFVTLCSSNNGPGFGAGGLWLHWVPHTEGDIAEWQYEHPAICGWGGFRTTVTQYWSQTAKWELYEVPDIICPTCRQMMGALLGMTPMGDQI